MKSSTIKHVKAQVCETTPDGIIQIIAIQMDRAGNAKDRIETEGIVVRDMKGSVIAHPAIKIEIDASKIVAELLQKHKKSSDVFGSIK